MIFFIYFSVACGCSAFRGLKRIKTSKKWEWKVEIYKHFGGKYKGTFFHLFEYFTYQLLLETSILCFDALCSFIWFAIRLPLPPTFPFQLCQISKLIHGLRGVEPPTYLSSHRLGRKRIQRFVGNKLWWNLNLVIFPMKHLYQHVNAVVEQACSSFHDRYQYVVILISKCGI